MSAERRGWPYEPVTGPPPPPPSPPPVEEPPFPEPLMPARAGPRWGLILLAFGGAMGVLLASFGAGDWWMRNREMETLLERMERAERAQLPAIQGIGPMLFLCQQEAAGGLDEEDDLCDTVAIREGAERALPRLRETGDQVAGTSLTSFHGSLRSFRDRYVEHNLAWRGWLETLAQDPTAGDFDSPDSINTTFRDASDAADEALTPFPLHGNRERVERIFESVR